MLKTMGNCVLNQQTFGRGTFFSSWKIRKKHSKPSVENKNKKKKTRCEMSTFHCAIVFIIFIVSVILEYKKKCFFLWKIKCYVSKVFFFFQFNFVGHFLNGNGFLFHSVCTRKNKEGSNFFFSFHVAYRGRFHCSEGVKLDWFSFHHFSHFQFLSDLQKGLECLLNTFIFRFLFTSPLFSEVFFLGGIKNPLSSFFLLSLGSKTLLIQPLAHWLETCTSQVLATRLDLWSAL